ncbi:interleukin-17 receptor C [Pholidichthys leucotaenia]
MARVVSMAGSLLGVWLFLSAEGLESFDQDTPKLTCSKGLTHCRMSAGFQFSAALPDPHGPVNIIQLQLRVILCCSSGQDCKPCLQINITLQVENVRDVYEDSGDYNDEEGSNQMAEVEGGALVKVCLSTPGHPEIWRTLQFKLNYFSLDKPSKQSIHTLLLTEKVGFGIPVVVIAESKQNHTNITKYIPPLEEVCSTKLKATVKECNVPRLRAVPDHKRNMFRLQLENTNATQGLNWQMVWNEIHGEIHTWPKDEREVVIPSDIVVPCLCFQVWWHGRTRGRYCPFENQQDALEQMQHNVSVTVAESLLREGGHRLSWNITAPCRLEAEVWLCRKDLSGSQCEEVKGSRQTLQAGWTAACKGHWHTGEFNVSSHPLLCVQIMIKGMKSYLEPQCPFTSSRSQWILTLLIVLLLVCLAILGAYFMQGILQGYVWKWLNEDDVKGAVGGGHVVLLYPPDDDQGLPYLLCHLGYSLQALGFSVSLDLWSQTELGALGPVPWLHSRLDRLQRQGGKVVLVLTQAACKRAEEWGARSWGTNTFMERNRDSEEDGGKRYPTSSHCVDVFSASLSCILADYLQGRAGKRFMLVQFESLPPAPLGSFSPLPELFRGLHVYSLPSQSLGFLTELAGACQMATASARRKRAGGLRMASRALAQRLSGFTAGTNVLRLTGVSQSFIGLGVEDAGETVPLQPSLLTPPSSPDTDPKASEIEWV